MAARAFWRHVQLARMPVTLMHAAGCGAGAEKISTVQEAADLISSQVSSA